MPTTVLTPLAKGTARPVGASLWRRQLLPLGEIHYDGRKIAFTRDYLAGLVKAFAARAYDVVPFQFADADNRHTNKPEQRRGTVKALELTDDGLDVLIEAGPDAAAHLREYPDLGVSASIVEAAPRADGRFFPAAIKHVLGTLDPRITGMRQWQAVEASSPWQCVDFTADEGEIVNLTSYDYAPPDALPAAIRERLDADGMIRSPAPQDAPEAPSEPVQPELPAADQSPDTEDKRDGFHRRRGGQAGQAARPSPRTSSTPCSPRPPPRPARSRRRNSPTRSLRNCSRRCRRPSPQRRPSRRPSRCSPRPALPCRPRRSPRSTSPTPRPPRHPRKSPGCAAPSTCPRSSVSVTRTSARASPPGSSSAPGRCSKAKGGPWTCPTASPLTPALSSASSSPSSPA